ncbi:MULTISPECIES: M1 family metallopeptidase [unclassified Carboxylicivirga]|uniref:M1 family metallopeptidase n=1 Tax=Carboxylicivirga TaxID=1628153 RepID=UPI003D34BFE7
MKSSAHKLFVILLFSYSTISAQETELFEPIHYRNAVENKTRSRDGHPGPNYWQNHADYNMVIKLDTTEKKIIGKETVTYYNESPDTIQSIVLRLYPNLLKKGAIRNMKFDAGNINEGMILDTLIINGQAIDLNAKSCWFNGTNLLVRNIKPLPPNKEMDLVCHWNYELATFIDFRRTGYYKDNTWFIGYFYPQIAVYDDLEYFFGIKGWDIALSHLGLQEFYNDFNNYTVEIEVPDEFYVWATGKLVNKDEVYSDTLLNRIELAHRSEDNVQLLAGGEQNRGKLTGNKWCYKARGIPDFAFGTAMNHVWEASSVMAGNKRIAIDVAYHQESARFPLVMNTTKETLKYASEIYPGIAFPYPHVTVFNGMHIGGMEFPMIANNADTDTAICYLITFHELFHNYAPFMLGLNEKRYPFMDEGLAQYFTDHFLLHKYDDDSMAGTGNIMEVYTRFAANNDVPIFQSSYSLNQYNLFYYYYIKPNIAYRFFAEMVGEKNFTLAFKEFAARWKGKHPTAYDFFYTMNDVLDENFNWFWKAWFFDVGYPDLGLKIEGNVLIVRREGAGSLPVPIKLNIEYIDGSITTLSKSAKVWESGRKEYRIKLKDRKKIKSISVDTKKVPDMDAGNNVVSLD